MISANFGAGKGDRIVEILKYALGTAAVFGAVWTALAVFLPNFFVRIFMTPTEEILAIAPDIIRSYGISFLLLPFNIFSTYYFQALMKPKSFVCCFGFQRCGNQWNFYLRFPGCVGSKCNLVCYAGNGIVGCNLCNNEDDTIHESNICARKIVKKRSTLCLK